MAQRLTPQQFKAILRKDVRLPNQRFTYSRDPADAASCRFYVLSPSASNEVDNIVSSMLAGNSYSNALQEHATQDNYFENHAGRRDPSAPTPYHLIAALRVLRYWAEDRDSVPDGSSVFSQQHLLELLRVTYLLYNQERQNAVGSDAVILRHEQVFGADAGDRDCSRDILYEMYHVCHTLADYSTVNRFNEKEKDDNNSARLAQLSKKHRGHRTETQYVDGGYYWRDERGESTLFHALPLQAGRRQPGDDQGHGWQHVTIPEAQFRIPTSTEYRRGDTTVVRVTAYDNYWMARGLGNGDQEYGRADEVVADANDGNRDAAKILLSYCFEDEVRFESSRASAWCRYTADGYEQLGEYLTMRGAVLAMGMPLETEHGDFVFPKAVGGQLAYLTRTGAGDVAVEWREPDSLTVLARQYRKFPGKAKLVYQ